MKDLLTAPEALLLDRISGIKGATSGAYNIRRNSECCERAGTKNISITPKTDRDGIDVKVLDGTKGETCHIPVIITHGGVKETVFNDIVIGDDCDVTIVAGCGVHNCDSGESRHDGVHTFVIGKNSRVVYTEKHYGEGDGGTVMNPQTVVYLGEGSTMQMETVQIGGVDSTVRGTKIVCAAGAEAVVTERLMTHGSQTAESDMEIVLDGVDSRCRVISRSVAKDGSQQRFCPRVVGNAPCFGHVQCDSIIMGEARISSVPEIAANCTDAQLVHEAAIGRIAGDQLLKLQTLGLTSEEAEDRILKGFLA